MFTSPWFHPLFEAAAYLTGAFIYRQTRARRGDVVDRGNRFRVFVATIIGAAVGSKLLHHLAAPAEFQRHWAAGGIELWHYLMGGKTIVGGLLGGWIAVEWGKKIYSIRTRTGDLFAIPLAVGIAVGRFGCLLSGPGDDTLGSETTSPFGIDFGDGVFRHPTPLYEILFLIVLTIVLSRHRRAMLQGGRWIFPTKPGDSFRLFLLSYLGFRFAIDFLKPYEVVFGLRVLQWACLLGVLVLSCDLIWRARPTQSDPSA